MNKIKCGLYFFIIFFLINFIFFYINNFFLQKKEHYLTYFLPYYKRDLTLISNFYMNEDNNKNYIKTKINYDIIKIGTSNLEQDFSIILLDYFISNSNTNRAESIIYNYKLSKIRDLLDKKINFVITNILLLFYYQQLFPNLFQELRLISKLYKQYFYFFTKKMYNVFSLDEIPTNFKIGIIKDSYEFYFYKLFFKNLNYQENIDYKIVLYDDYEQIFQKFIENDCQMIFLIMSFPNKILSNFLDKNVFDDIIFLPFNFKNEDIFKKKLPCIKIDNIDLNLLSKSYLPKKFGNNEYTIFRPNIKAASCYNILITTQKTSNENTYNFIKFLFENYKIINENLPSTNYYIYADDIDNTDLNLMKFHPGVIKYYFQQGIFTYESNYNCKYLYGIMECNKNNLENNIFPDN